MYGSSPRGGWPIVVVGITGVCFMFYYLIKFLQYSNEDDFEKRLVFPVAGVMVLIGVAVFFYSNMQGNILFLCFIAAFWRGFTTVTPHFKLGVVLEENSMDGMPSLLTCTLSLASAILLACFACTGKDWDLFVMFPSVVGMVSAGVMVGFHLKMQNGGELHQPLVVPQQ